jgi:hypothetical protein
MYHNLKLKFSMLINRVHGPSYVVAPAIGHKLTFFRGSAPHGTWNPVRTFPNWVILLLLL